MADIRRIPFTELFERVMTEMVRDRTGAEAKYKGRINDQYTQEIPAQIDWRHIRLTSSITTIDDRTTGYITDISSTTVTGDSDVAWTSANSNNMLLKVSGYDELYRVTYSSATALTLDRTWIGDAISSTDTSYTLFQDRYALSSDYDRMIQDPDRSVYYYSNGSKVYLEYKTPEEFESLQVYQPNTPTHYTIKWVNGDPYLFVNPPDNTSRSMFYTYIPALKRMSEYTTGTITTLANAGTAVTGSGTDFDGFVSDTTNYDYYFRIDGDGTGSSSKWYKISTAGSNTSLTRSDAYEGTAIAAGTETYTISMVSRLPPGLDLAFVYGAALVSSVDQDNEKQTRSWAGLLANIISKYAAIEGKKDYGKQRVRTIYERPGVRR
jgi:hypothetical protein